MQIEYECKENLLETTKLLLIIMFVSRRLALLGECVVFAAPALLLITSC